MKVLLISPAPPPAGGIATWTERYIDWMQSNGHEIDLINTAVQGKRAENYTKKSFSEELIRSLKIVFKMCSCLMKNKYDVVHLNTSCSKSGIIRDKILSDVLNLFHVKVFVQCHCNLTRALRNERSKRLFGRMIEDNRKCFVLNNDSKEFVVLNYNKEAMLIPNFISNDYLDVIKTHREHNDTIKTALYVGHLLRTKGCDIIIEAAKTHPDIEFRLVGHISADIAKIERTENVIFTGEKTKSELWEEYKNADVLLFPTHTEGFPLTVVEAMAFGLPIITTRVGAIPDILEEKGALYIPIGDTSALSQMISTVEDKTLRKKMSEFNKTKVITTYMIDNVMNELNEKYSQN